MSLSPGHPRTRAVLSPSARVSIPQSLPWFLTVVPLFLVPFIIWDLFSKHFATALAQLKLSDFPVVKQNLCGAVPVLYGYFVLIEFLYCNSSLHFDRREKVLMRNQWPYSHAGASSPTFSLSIKLNGLNAVFIIDHTPPFCVKIDSRSSLTPRSSQFSFSVPMEIQSQGVCFSPCIANFLI